MNLSIVRSDPTSTHWQKDLAWVQKAYCDAVSEEQASQGPHARHIDPSRIHEVTSLLESLLSDQEHSCLLLAKDGEGYCGYFLGWIKACPAEVPSWMGYINGLYMVPSHRGKGGGQLLLDQGRAWFSRQGIDFIELYLALSNRLAKSFWVRNGFAPTEEVLSLSLKNKP